MGFDGDKLLGWLRSGSIKFKLVGGHPALDFINTVRDWTVAEPHDYLSEFGDAIRFGERAGFLTRGDVLRLRRRTPHLELTRLRELRALLKRVFQMRLSGKAPSSRTLGNSALPCRSCSSNPAYGCDSKSPILSGSDET